MGTVTTRPYGFELTINCFDTFAMEAKIELGEVAMDSTANA